MMRSGLAKFLLGIVLAIAVLMFGGVAVAFYFMTRVTTSPPKPVFANDKPEVKAQSGSTSTARRSTKPAQPSTPSPSEKPLEPGAYQARVTWADGLSLRSEPQPDAERIGGIEYDQQIVVLAESPDKNWQRVRLADGEQTGWIKAGNIERVSE